LRLAFLALPGVLGACWATTPPAVPPSASTPVVAHVRGPDYRATIADPFGFLPADSDLIMAIDVVRLRAGSLGQTYEPKLRAKFDPTGSPAMRCAVDVALGLGSLTLGFKQLAGDQKFAGVMVFRGLDVHALRTCIAKQPAGPDTPTVVGETIVSRGSTPTALRAIDPHTMVGVVGPDATPAALDRVLASGSPLATSPRFATVLDQLELHQVMWLAIAGEAEAMRTFQALGFPPEVVFGSIDATDFLSSTVHLRFASPTIATGFQTMASSQLGAARGFIQRLDITAVDRDVVFELAINDAQLAQLLGIVGLTP
jgi:hypothetical protein